VPTLKYRTRSEVTQPKAHRDMTHGIVTPCTVCQLKLSLSLPKTFSIYHEKANKTKVDWEERKKENYTKT